MIGDKSKINDLNNKVISNATYVYLKEQEYFVINKYNDDNFDTLNKLFDEFERFKLKMSYDIYFQAKMAGAKDLKEVEDWMKDIHS